MGALEVTRRLVPSVIGEPSTMQRLASLVGLAFGALLLAACSEGFEDTVWDDDGGTKTLSLYEGGAAWEERSLLEVEGEAVVADGLRFEGVFTEGEEAIDVDVRCVSAKNDQLATPCDTKVARALACTLAKDDDAKLTCTVGKETVDLFRRGVRRVTR